MLQKIKSHPDQGDLFRNRLNNIINMKHKLVRLSLLIDWNNLEKEFSSHYTPNNGRPALPIRLMSGLLMLKEIEGVSDEGVVELWLENPYWQYFCGEQYFNHKFPCTPENLVYFRKRIGEAGMERLLQETINIAHKIKILKPADYKRVTIDSTVIEKNITFPTDSKLQNKAREELIKKAKEFNIKIRQTYQRLSKESLFMSNRYSSSRKIKKAKAERKKIKNYLGRVIRDIKKGLLKLEDSSNLKQNLEQNKQNLKQNHNPKSNLDKLISTLERAKKIYNQQISDKNKIYSWHEHHIDCISKGKQHKKYEFGTKASFAVSSRANFIFGAKSFNNNPYDGHTLKEALNQVIKLTKRKPKEAYTDQGYKNHKITDIEIIHTRQKTKSITKLKKFYQKRRNAIEPIIGHIKNDLKRGARNFLKGEIGDKINTISIATGYNLRKLLNYIESNFLRPILWLIYTIFLQKIV